MRLGWLAIIPVILFAFACSDRTNVDKRDGSVAPGGGGVGGMGKTGDASSAGRVGGSGGGKADSGGGSSLGGASGRASEVGGAGDGGSGADAGSDAGSLTDFCTGAFARMVVNGIDSGPSVLGTELPLDCCFAAEFTVTTATFAHLIVVLWRVPVGSSTTIPATFDLTNPLPGWTVRVYVDCEPDQGNCNPAPDSYETGLQGTLHVGLGDSGTAFDMTLCLSVAEPAGVPHPIVHSLQLYAPHVTTTY